MPAPLSRTPAATGRTAGACIAIGAFDGVHLGHQAVVGAMLRQARSQGMAALVQTFDPLPKVAFGRGRPICPLAERMSRLYALGVDRVHVANFTSDYAARPAEAFLDDLTGLDVREVYVGDDFRFGRGRSGDLALLATRFRVTTAESVTCPRGERISSTRIRRLRAGGEAGAARALLGLLPGAFAFAQEAAVQTLSPLDLEMLS
ncbi:riboflavin kinase/FMN adenylyltransferase [Pseudaminobacter salicylatoxidans]|uniref:FAD synthase n=1 Tax=Pseudaminobacter salicylatoxidans TaxID=93369 RepID=A0A316C4D1_PSESE|nr:FAD synthetase family protein [Pseudaminobacter salicylatoxidans]PWJ84541.1 riboflavin kinase/FMN adenylyltransferase [Pseudaminobacter salicylatoxidans]